jgi:hypothetical protein
MVHENKVDKSLIESVEKKILELGAGGSCL